MNNEWRTELENTDYDCYIRLCECRNTRNDIINMAKLVRKYNPTVDPENCLVYMLEWVGDWNNQYEVADFPIELYNRAVNSIQIAYPS